MSIFALVITAAWLGAAPPPEPFPPVPTPQQLAWQDMEFGMFCHFGINTFHDLEWSDGTKTPDTFNPTAFDAFQWAKTAKDVGVKYLVVTAKHHDGFAVYPTKFSEYSLKASPWRDGRGDVVKEVAEACRQQGVMFGFYLSPWDRHEPQYADPPAYDAHFKDMLRELLTQYGPVGEVWFDGAGSEGHLYDWNGYYGLIRELQPSALIAICGPDIRWVGNEDGLAPETLWNVQERDGKPIWYPAECDVPIREGQWFFHTDGESKLRSLGSLLDIFYRSIGHGATLLLNVSPDRRGQLPEADVARLKEFSEVISETFRDNLAQQAKLSASNVRGNDGAFAPEQTLKGLPETYWATDDGVTQAWLEIDFGAPRTFDRVAVKEQIALGQRVAKHMIEAWDGQTWKTIGEGATIGHLRIHRLPETTAAKVRLNILEAKACPVIRSIGVYKSSPREAATVTPEK